jgi:hypothetical protein
MMPVKRKRGAPRAATLSMTMLAELRQLLGDDSHAVSPVHALVDRRADHFGPALEAWRDELGLMDVGLAEGALVPISTSEHDDVQLEFGRAARLSGVPIPTCAYGADCTAFKVMGVKQALHQFMTPAEQRQVDEAAVPVFEPDGACLLCIRALHHSMNRVRAALVLNPRAELGRDHMTVPPFQNLVGQPGGYKSSAMGVTPCSYLSLAVNVVGGSGALQLAVNPITGREYIDQEALKYGMDFRGGASV